MGATRLAAMTLFTFVLTIYLQTFGAVFYSIDEDIYLRITRSLIEERSFAITPIEYAPEFSVARGLDGQMYANRGPAFPIVAVPFYLLGKALTSLGSPYTSPSENGIDDPTVFTLSLTLTNAFIIAATVALLFVTLVRLGYGRRASAAVALLLAFGTMAWPYASKSFFAEPLLALCVLAAFYSVLRYRQGGSPLMLLVAGAFVGWGVLTKATAFVLIPWLAAYAVWPDIGRSVRWRQVLTRLRWLAAGVAPFVLAWMAFNYLRFGGVLTTGYELEGGLKPLLVGEPGQFLAGLYGLLLSSGKGLLIYAAPVLLGLWAAPRFWRAHRAESVFVFGTSATTVVGVALWRDWSGGWCWGPRLVLDVVPLLLIPAVALLSSVRTLRRRALWAIGGLTVFSGVVQLLGVLPNYLEWYWVAGDYNLVYFSPMYSPLVGHWQAVISGNMDLFWDKVKVFFPEHEPTLAAVRWAVAGIAAAAGWTFWRVIRADTGRRASSLVAFSEPTKATPAGPRPSRLFLWQRRLARHPQLLVALALGLVLILGAYFRLVGLDWDSGQHLQPDERFVTMVATDTGLPSGLGQYFDSTSSPLNPYNRGHKSYPYGTSFLFLAKFLAGPTGMEGYDRIYLLGRFLSVLADLGTVVLVFLLGRRLYNPWAGLLGAFLYSAAVLPIQYSHFFVAESFTTLFVTLTLFLAVRVSQGGGWPSYLGMGAACGLALASKASVALVVPVMVVAGFLAYRGRRGPWPLLGMAASLAAALLAFRVVQPYAFAGTGFLDLRPSLQFLGDIETQRRMAEGSLEFPYTLQWASTIPYLYPLQNLFWGLGPALAAAALVGAGLALYQLGRGRRLEHLLVLLWVGLAFLYFGGQMVKFMRYLLPIYPFLALLAAHLLVWLAGGLREKAPIAATPRPREGRVRADTSPPRPLSVHGEGVGGEVWRKAYPLLFSLCLVTILLGTLLWAVAFTRIYTSPLTRAEASRWIYQNLPPGTVVANEHWDDPLPLTLEGRDPGQYGRLTLELYNDDSPAKLETLVGQLARADYIFLSSNRLYGSIPRLPLRYPMTTEYYRLLFSGDLGFEKAQTFTSYPNLGPLEIVDDGAEEAFTVYDHPKVLIFQKSASFSREGVRQLLSSVPVDNVIRQGPREAAVNALLMPPDLLRANRTGGTWTEAFNPQGLPSRFPFLTWYLLVQALSLAALPLGLAALGRLPDGGYPLLKALGILLVAYFSWLAASLRLAPYTQATILAAAVLVALLSGLALWRWWGHIREALRGQGRLVLATEVLFLSAFAAFYLIRLANPDLWHAYRGGEKPMDLAYLNAVVKSTYFPPYDPWFAGGYINYYYFGQVLVATLAKLTAIPTATTYNLAVPLFFALTVLGAFSAGYNLLAMGNGRERPFLKALIGGLAAALLVAVVGNLDGLFQLIQGLWGLNPQPFQSPWPGVSGLVNAWLGLGQALGGKSLPIFDYWRSSRLMSPAFSITEFPYFTFLFADLHPHLIALPYTLLALGFILTLVRGSGRNGATWSAQVFLVALSLGALWVINSWDFPTYFLLAAAVLLLRQVRRGLTWPAVGRWLLLAVGLFLASYLLYYPFHHYYQQFYAGVNPSPEKTPLHQYLGVHGLFLLILGSYLLSRLGEGLRRVPGGWLLVAPGAVVLAGILAALVLSGLPTAAFLVFLSALALLALASGGDQPSRLAVLLIAAALILGLGVEFATIKGDIQRMNTVFKFYLQAWVLMGVASAYCLVVLLGEWRRRPWLAYPWTLLVAVALWAALLYPLGATPVRVADRFLALPPSPDGMGFMRAAQYRDEKGEVELAWDYRAIRWMQENIQGSPVVLEGVTPLYRWGSRVSIYTGLPTVIGWDWHQKQQRAGYQDLVESRLSDVRAMYSTTDTTALLRLLRKYEVSYIYVGHLERNYYPAPGLTKFEALEGTALRRVYQEGPVSIYQVAPPP